MEKVKEQYVVDGENDVNEQVKRACESTPTELHLKTSYKLVKNKNALSNHADDMLIHEVYGNPSIKVGAHCKTDSSARNAIISIRLMIVNFKTDTLLILYNFIFFPI